MNRIAVGLLVCALAISALAQQPETLHSQHSQAPAKKVEQQKVYSCPMHPEVTAKSKGKCPKCGMDLRLADQKEVTTEASHELASSAQLSKMNIPDVELLDQD
jgi:rubrerythrin